MCEAWTQMFVQSNHQSKNGRDMKHRLFVACGVLTAALLIAVGTVIAENGSRMKTLNLETEIGEGKGKHVEVLFEGPRRQIVQITLRNNGVLDSHKAAEPITIQCVAGEGTMSVGEEKQSVELTPGVLVTIEPNTIHEIHGQPAVSILLSRFGQK
jgi:quercetin dioxygenase-like cupin family protein